jgi:hypothetical protein
VVSLDAVVHQPEPVPTAAPDEGAIDRAVGPLLPEAGQPAAQAQSDMHRLPPAHAGAAQVRNSGPRLPGPPRPYAGATMGAKAKAELC